MHASNSGFGTYMRLPATVLGTVQGFDGVDTTYTFGVYALDAVPVGMNAVYAFCRIENGRYIPLHIGRAEDLAGRLGGHERKAEAARLGATVLLVHTPPPIGARVGYATAERRLISHYNPPLNTQHSTLGAILAGAR